MPEKLPARSAIAIPAKSPGRNRYFIRRYSSTVEAKNEDERELISKILKVMNQNYRLTGVGKRWVKERDHAWPTKRAP